MQQDTASEEEYGLLEALHSLVTRASRNPKGLLQRIQVVVDMASQGRLRPKQKIAKPRNGDAAPATPSRHVRPSMGDSWVQVVKRGDKGKSKGKGKTKDANKLPSAAPVNARPGAKQSGNKGQVSARLMPSSFPDGALIPREFLLQELRKGKAPENKWAWVASKQEANETKELAAIHKLSVKVGLLYQTTDDSDSATTVKLPVLRAGQITIEEFKIAPLTVDVPGKLGQTVRKSSAQPVQRKLATFRCTLPKEFAKEGAWKDASSNIQKVIRQFCSDDAFHSSYQWQRRECWSKAGHCDEYLEGYVRIADEHADKFARMSGRSGCFFERLSREQKKPLVQWVPRQESESSSTYFSRVERAAKEAQQPAAFRKGGRDSLGIKYLTGAPKKVPVCWELKGSPGFWTQSDLCSALEGAGWTELEVLAPPRRGQVWRIRGVNPGDVSDFVEAVEVGKHILVIQRCTGAKPTKITTHPLRKVFGDGGPSGHKTRVAMQTDSGEAETATADSHKQEGDGSSKKRETVTKGPDSKRSKHDSFDGYSVRDCGGNGACGYNCLAMGKMLADGAKWNDIKDEAQTRGRTLRVEVQQHVKRHPETYKSAWAKDPQWTEVSEGGSVPENYQQWEDSLAESCSRLTLHMRGYVGSSSYAIGSHGHRTSVQRWRMEESGGVWKVQVQIHCYDPQGLALHTA